MQCTKCGAEHERRVRIVNNKTTYFDEEGNKWSGKRCYRCHLAIMAEYRVKYLAEKDKEQTTTEEPKTFDDLIKVHVDKKKRKCRKCNKMLPQDRYYHHTRCEPGAQDYETDFEDVHGLAKTYENTYMFDMDHVN